MPPPATPAPPRPIPKSISPSPRPTKPSPAPKPTPSPRPTPRDPAATREAAERREEASKATDAARKGKAQEGQSALASAADAAAYGATIYAEIARHKGGVGSGSGSVGVTFVVGASGRIVSHSIVKSSGDAGLDARVNAMMDAVQAPPPPGGRFAGRITIRFNGS